MNRVVSGQLQCTRFGPCLFSALLSPAEAPSQPIAKEEKRKKEQCDNHSNYSNRYSRDSASGQA